MEDPTTIAMNLTYFATLGVGLVLFLGVFLAFVAILLLAGLGRLVTNAGSALFRGRTPASASQAVKPAKAARDAAVAKPERVKPPKPARKEPQLSPEWAAAVERADERASARAKAHATPEVRVSVRELPSRTAPAHQVRKVGPLVESATDRNGLPGAPPRAFTKPPVPAQSPILDTGSLATLKHQPAKRGPERKAS